MVNLQDWYSAREIADLAGLTERAIQLRAEREGWQWRKREGQRGGGKEYHRISYPQKILNSMSCALAKQHVEAQRNQPAEVQLISNSLNGIPQHGKRLAEAKMYVVNYSLALQKATGKPLTNVLFEVACQFENRTAPFPEWVCQALRGASRCSIRNWINEEKENGICGLAKQHKRRVPRNIIDNNPKLKEIALG